MRVWKRPLSVVAAIAAVIVCLPLMAAPADAEVSRGVTIPAFYDPPSTLPSANGALIRSEPLPLALSLPGIDGPLPGTATRLMYKSTDSNGEPVAVTGAYIEPSATWHHSGPRPLVALAPGTMGQGDQCSASMGLEHPLTVTTKTASIGYEDLAIYRLLSRGIAVVVTDYVGLGATDRLHTYVNRVDGGHALLDAARAAHQVDGASITASSPVGLFGYSEGGGASASAAELQPGYAPNMNLVGTYAGAPPANLTAVTKSIDGSELTAAVGWALNGFVQSYPDLKPLLDAHLTPDGQAALANMSTMCIGEAILTYAYHKTSQWTTDGKTVSEIIAGMPQAQAVLQAQRIGNGRPTTPVRVATAVADNLVPHKQARQLAVDWCHKGVDVDYQPILIPSIFGDPLLNHLAGDITDQGSAISWITDRLAGEQATSNCWSMPIQP